MADHTLIEWTDATWNPITGCSVLSPGCTNCYAMKLAGTRMKHHESRAGLTVDTKAGPVWNGEVRLNEQWLTQPLQWKRPRRVFVCAHADLFHQAVPDEWIDRVFAVMALAPHHTFQVLTKRSKRMREYMAALNCDGARRFNVAYAAGRMMEDGDNAHDTVAAGPWPLPNAWLGVSVEDQKRANERIPDLLATPAAVRWSSAEPLLGGLILNDWMPSRHLRKIPDEGIEWHVNPLAGRHMSERGDGGPYPKLDWVVVGGESGHHARPMYPDWARSLRDQCAAAGVAFLFKQWGEWAPQVGAVDGWTIGDNPEISRFDHRNWNGDKFGKPFRPSWDQNLDDDTVSRIGKRRAGRLLDGVEHNGYPEVRP